MAGAGRRRGADDRAGCGAEEAAAYGGGWRRGAPGSGPGRARGFETEGRAAAAVALEPGRGEVGGEDASRRRDEASRTDEEPGSGAQRGRAAPRTARAEASGGDRKGGGRAAAAGQARERRAAARTGAAARRGHAARAAGA